MKSAMKTAMKAKAMKKKSVSKVAKGMRAKVVVFKGNKEKTQSGHAKTDLMKSKTGKIVTKKSHAAGVKAYKHISAWTRACQAARKELGIKGFCPVNIFLRTKRRLSFSKSVSYRTSWNSSNGVATG